MIALVPYRSHRRGGFTLIEVAAATLMLAVLAGSVAWTFSKPIATVRGTEAVGRLRMFDALARQTARTTGRESAMTFDPSTGSLVRHEDVSGRDPVATHSASLPPGYRLHRVRTLDATTESRNGLIAIRCSVNGRTLTYAVHLVGPELDRWLVFAGMTGQVTTVQSEAEVVAIFNKAAHVDARFRTY